MAFRKEPLFKNKFIADALADLPTTDVELGAIGWVPSTNTWYKFDGTAWVDNPVPVDNGSAWCITLDSSANAINTITQAAVAGKTHYIDGFSAAITAADAANAITLEIKDGATTIYKDYIGTGMPRGTSKGIVFRRPLACTAGNAVSLVIAAGGAAVVSTGNLFGVTK